MGEFLGRERGLGDLTDDILAERERIEQNMLYAPSSPSPYNIPPAPVQQPGDETGRDIVPYGIKTQSVFDSRPINATDFNVKTRALLAPYQGEATVLFAKAVFTPPNGFIAILRNIEFSLLSSAGTPFIPVSALNGVTLQVKINGIVQPYFVDDIAYDTYEKIDSFVVVPQNSELEVNVIYDWATDLTGPSFGLVHLYGNVIMDTGLPANYLV